MIDLGAYSSRPGADDIDPAEELKRLLPAIRIIKDTAPGLPLSVDTFRSSVARQALDAGADIVNDISGGTLDPDMDRLIAESRVPYILMHMRGTPSTMQSLTDYSDAGGVAAEVMRFLAMRLATLRDKGAGDIILDPGFGFAKTVDANWDLMRELPVFADTFSEPILAGISRKSMLYKPLGLAPADVLPATVAANVLAMQSGASILRVHDVSAAVQARAVLSMADMESANTITHTYR